MISSPITGTPVFPQVALQTIDDQFAQLAQTRAAKVAQLSAAYDQLFCAEGAAGQLATEDQDFGRARLDAIHADIAAIDAQLDALMAVSQTLAASALGGGR